MIEQAYASGYGPLKSGNDLKLWLVPLLDDFFLLEDLTKYARSLKDNLTMFITALYSYEEMFLASFKNLAAGTTNIFYIISSQDYSKFAKEIPWEEMNIINTGFCWGEMDDEGNTIQRNNNPIDIYYNLVEKYFPQN